MPTQETSKYTFQKMEDLSTWNDFVEKSPDGTIYSRLEYLKATNRKVDYYSVLKGTEVRAVLPIIISDKNSTESEFEELVIYGGICLFKQSPNERQQSMLSKRFEILEFAIAELAKRYARLSLPLCPSLSDIRPFLWHNYHSQIENEKFKVRVRYTTLLNISSLNSGKQEIETEAFEELSSSRKQEIRYARKDGVFSEESKDLEKFIELYIATFDRQSADMNVVQERAKRVKSVCQTLMDSNLGKLFLVKNKNGDFVSGTFFGLDSKRAYYLFGGSDFEKVDRYSGTIVLWDALKALGQMGLKEVDLEGVNSPNRGWFKLSFGGSLTPYYQCILDPGKK